MENLKNKRKLEVFIVDDEQYSIDLLSQELKQIPMVNIVGAETHYTKAIKKIKQLKPDLLFLDVEMPCKSGFELLQEIRREVNFSFHVIFYTAYDKYAIQALRASALDFILKPVQRKELLDAIERLKDKEKQTTIDKKKENRLFPNPGDVIAIPTYTGIRFLKTNEIVYLVFKKEKGWNKGNWIVHMHNNDEIRLRSGLNSRKLFEICGNVSFIQINQSTIINMNYINTIEIKSKQCILLPPFEKTLFVVSRNYMGEIREKFEHL